MRQRLVGDSWNQQRGRGNRKDGARGKDQQKGMWVMGRWNQVGSTMSLGDESEGWEWESGRNRKDEHREENLMSQWEWVT